ncbi:hypothetical protein C439_10035 [Haloferax mediterranei ATCC 33500]|uniref:Uncharacterized protein n=1 Tax=Haloferax mediterranei (strain ATCC 33500 / DSM 1411 / JCM 8866 / NBRC 14739 / NCIMB 2177 / R-4) TaxID=523841 RepID=M0J4I2_HALMT|nr:hypothetical protein BM92_08930 [Haloferax mediterranei ATCC 33500]EMA02914.1 hypothetical protein C439_10035 [Haloferax mediterranei ATCC 33500]
MRFPANVIECDTVRIDARRIRIRRMLPHERVCAVVLYFEDLSSSSRLDFLFDWVAKSLDTVLNVREHGFQFRERQRIDPLN